MQVARRQALGGVLILALVLALAVIMLIRQANIERAREIAALGDQQALIAASRAEAVEAWIDEGRALVEGLAENPAVQVYALGARGGEGAGVAAGQAQYLQTLLAAAASRTNFAAPRAALPANVKQPTAAGLAVVAPDGGLIALYGGPLPPPAALLRRAAAGAATDGAARLGDRPAIAFAAPVFAPQTGDGAPVAYIYGVRALGEDLAARLVQPGDPLTSGRAILVDRAGKPRLAAPGQPLETALPAAAAPLLDKAGDRLAEAGDALLRVRPVDRIDWRLVRLVDPREALAPARERWRLRVFGWTAALSWLAAVLLLAWRNSAARQSRSAAEMAQAATQREEALRGFLQSVADYQPTLIVVADADGRLTFSNARAQLLLGIGPDARSVPAPTLFGPHRTTVAAMMADAPTRRADSEPALLTLGKRSIALQSVAMAHGQVLLVGSDVTDLLAEQGRRVAGQQALVTLLTGLIDARDPGSARHSEKVSRLAVAMGAQLGLSSIDRETLRSAGLLMNLGKVMVPRALLTRAGPLDADERRQVQEALATGAALLNDVPFDGPVAATVAALHNGDDHNLAHILRLANAFISLVSPRAFRAALSPADAIEALRGEQGASHAILAALEHFLENGGGKEALGLG